VLSNLVRHRGTPVGVTRVHGGRITYTEQRIQDAPFREAFWLQLNSKTWRHNVTNPSMDDPKMAIYRHLGKGLPLQASSLGTSLPSQE
jgi:hypothetical protein